MKLRNKETGELAEPFGITCINGRTFVQFDDGKGTFKFEARSLAELNKEWEDYEEDKRYWFIDVDGEIKSKEMAWFNQAQDDIGNRFETKEEAEKAVERLRAWKRLKDKGFRFIPEFHRIEEGNDERENIMFIACTMDDDKDFIYGDNKDLKLLFGREE